MKVYIFWPLLFSQQTLESRNKTNRDLSLLGVAGVIGPIQFALLLYVAGLLRPGYNQLTQQISELGEIGGPTAVIQNSGFFLAGLLGIAFIWGLHRIVTQGEGSKSGPFLLTLAGIGLIGVSVYRCDPGCPFEGSTINTMHFVMFLTSVIAATVGMLAISPRLKRDSSWRRYRVYSLASGMLALSLLVAWFTTPLSDILGTGVTERLIAGIPLLWTEIMAIRMTTLTLG